MVQGGLGGQVVPGDVEHRLERVAFDDRLERRRTADHLEKGTVLLFNQIDAPLAPRRDHHLATRIEDLLDEFVRPHVDQLLREHERCKMCRGVVALVTLRRWTSQTRGVASTGQSHAARRTGRPHPMTGTSP